MEAIKPIYFIERPIDVSVLYHKIRQLEEKVTAMSGKDPILKLRTQSGVEIIPQGHIIRCQSDNNYTDIFTLDGRKICISKTLKFIQEQLSEDEFIRIHASHLVSIKEVRRILTKPCKSLLLSNGDCIPVSRTHNSEIEKIF